MNSTITPEPVCLVSNPTDTGPIFSDGSDHCSALIKPCTVATPWWKTFLGGCPGGMYVVSWGQAQLPRAESVDQLQDEHLQISLEAVVRERSSGSSAQP